VAAHLDEYRSFPRLVLVRVEEASRGNPLYALELGRALIRGGVPADPHEPLIGEDLRRVVLIKHARGSLLDRVKITVACDVTNPLFGPNGAARIFGPQKGATPAQVEELDALLNQLATRCGKLAEAQTPGAGAAGGLGFAMLAFFNATLPSRGTAHLRYFLDENHSWYCGDGCQ